MLWNAALVANPLGLIVAAIAAVVTGLVLFFTKTELGRKIWEKFTEYLKVAWEAIKIAFGAAWDAIRAIWDGMVTKAGEVWEGIRSRFTAVVDFVKGLPAAITAAAKGMWEGLKSGLVAVLNWIGDKWNSFADALSIDLPGTAFDVTIPKMPRFSFSDGGYTGNVAVDRVAGVVHGDEHVIKSDSRKRIENAYPGLLDYLNNNGALPLPGYAGGGRVALGDISGPGITTGEQQSMWDAIRSQFPDAILSSATRTVMTEGHPDFHNAGRAIDISGPSMGAIASWIASTYPDSLELIHSPFSHNIKNGKNVGDGTGFYGAGLMGAHRDHVHWALGKTARPSSGGADGAESAGSSAGSEMLSALNLGVDSGAPSAGSAAPAAGGAAGDSAASGQVGRSVNLSAPSSLSGVGSWAGQFAGGQIGSAVTDSVGGTDKLDPGLKSAVGGLGDLGSAAGSLIDGQVSSALSVFGVNDSPGWLKGLSTFVGGLSFGGKGGGGLFGGGDGGGQNSAAPVAATSLISSAPQSASAAMGSVHAGSGQQPGPAAPTYNIRTATVEDAFVQAQRREKERAAAKLSRF
jgi:hypothetical protein